MAIGDVKAPSTTINPVRARANPDAFGAGVARGLGNMSQAAERFYQSQENLKDAEFQNEQQIANAEFNLKEAQKSRDRKTRSAEATTSLIKLNSEVSRQTIERRLQQSQATEEGADGTTSVTVGDYDAQNQKATRSTYEAFLKSLDPDIRESFIPKVEQAIQGQLDSAFKYDASQRTVEYETNFSERMLAMTDSILSGASTPGHWTADVDELMELSKGVLPPAERKAKRVQLETALKAAHYQRERNVQALQPNLSNGLAPGMVADGSDIVAAGIPGAYRAVLNYAAGPESGGKYDIRFAGRDKKGVRFNDFSKHPNVRVPVVVNGKQTYSTAAGRYQIVYSTWLQAAKALNLKDFSPESQDRAAVWIAEDAWRRLSGSKIPLLTALESGDKGLIENVRRVLAGSGARTVWEGMQGLSPEGFYAKVTGTSASPNALVFDPRFAGVSYTDKIKMGRQAEQSARTMRAEQATEQKAQSLTAFNALDVKIELGDAGPEEIMQGVKQHGWSPEQRRKLTKLWEDKNESKLQAAEYASTGYNPADPQSKRKAESYYNEVDKTGIRALDKTVGSRAIQNADANNHISEGLKTDLIDGLYSANKNSQDFSLNLLAQLQDKDPALFDSAFDDNVSRDVALYSSGFFTEEQVNQQLATSNDPASQAVRKANRDLIKDFRKDAPNKFNHPYIYKKLGLTPSVDVKQQDVIKQEYTSVFEYFAERTGEASTAHELTQKQMRATWGDWNDNPMKYPPHLSGYQPDRNGSLEWVNEELRREVGVEAGTPIRLVALPGITDRMRQEGFPPAYGVMIPTRGADGEVVSGLFEMVYRSDENDELTGWPVVADAKRPEVALEAEAAAETHEQVRTTMVLNAEDLSSQITAIEGTLFTAQLKLANAEKQGGDTAAIEAEVAGLQESLKPLKDELAAMGDELKGHEEVAPDLIKKEETEANLTYQQQQDLEELERAFKSPENEGSNMISGVDYEAARAAILNADNTAPLSQFRDYLGDLFK